MNSKHRRTLVAIFAEPVSSTLEWASIEALLMSVGCGLIEGSGSRVRFNFQGAVATFHRPHPAKEANVTRYEQPAII